MKILVTGGTGFIGTHLIERLVKEGHRVRCLAKDRRNIELLESLGVETVIGDLNNGINFRSVLGGVKIVYHLAGITRAKQYREYHEGNYLATKNFLAMCAAFPSSHVSGATVWTLVSLRYLKKLGYVLAPFFILRFDTLRDNYYSNTTISEGNR